MNLSWRKQARCRGVDPGVFYPVSDEDEASEAKEICAECPVREPCLEYALTVREKHGVWGGAPSVSAGVSSGSAASPRSP